MQDTGIERHLPVGAGLLTFTDPASAAEAVERVEEQYSYYAGRQGLRPRVSRLGLRLISSLAPGAGVVEVLSRAEENVSCANGGWTKESYTPMGKRSSATVSFPATAHH